ncbi:hypothetical protein E4U60_007316 [Claviceps pazoutovae]|uniref:Threonine/serine exporter-like N-terminal domain-containing protein n=1 Tax=Claviceps pazoutovae TaxID=1649127 RepID=A0A9P7SDH0_9HYPO|nr:hypothetical protein E4U60_007316 [Claviceps pazoutovae]
MTISFDHSTTHTAEVKLARVFQGENLGKLQDVHDISMDVAHDRLGVEEAARRLDTVLDRRPKFQYHIKPPCYHFNTKPVMSNIHVNVMNVLQLPEIVPLQYATGRAVVETDRHAARDVYKLTFDLEGSRGHGHLLL